MRYISIGKSNCGDLHGRPVFERGHTMRNRANRRRGVALLVSVVAIICMIGLSLGLFYTSLADKQQSMVNQAMIQATALAEGATEQGNKELIEAATDGGGIPTGGSVI